MTATARFLAVSPLVRGVDDCAVSRGFLRDVFDDGDGDEAALFLLPFE